MIIINYIHNVQKEMGILTSDPLTYLIKEYGEDVCKYLVATKVDEFVEEKAPTFKEKIQ